MAITWDCLCTCVQAVYAPYGSSSLDRLVAMSVSFRCRSSSDEVFFSLSLIDDDISMVVDTRDINRCGTIPFVRSDMNLYKLRNSSVVDTL